MSVAGFSTLTKQALLGQGWTVSRLCHAVCCCVSAHLLGNTVRARSLQLCTLALRQLLAEDSSGPKQAQRQTVLLSR